MRDPITLIITRPEPEASDFAAACGMRLKSDLRILCSPLLRIEFLEELEAIASDATLLFTSKNGVRGAAERIGNSDAEAVAVGDATAEEARKHGFSAVSAGGDVEALIKLVKTRSLEGPLVHVRGEHATGDLVPRLVKEGFNATEIVAYRQEALALNTEAKAALEGSGTVIFPVFSPRSAEILAGEISRETADVHMVAISDATAACLKLGAAAVAVAKNQTADAMLCEIETLLAR